MKSARGFSLIELMVSIVIGMLAVVFVTRTLISFEITRRDSTGGSDSMQNGIVALFTMENEASQAGWGLNHPQVSGCDASFSDSSGFQLANVGGAVNPRPLAPVVINFSAVTGDPDTISFYSGSSPGGSGALPLFSDAAAGATSIDLKDPTAFGFKQNDVLLIAQTDGTCAVVQAASAPDPVVIGSSTVSRISLADARFSPPAGLPIASPSDGSLVFNLGSQATLVLHTWSIANGRLMLRASDLTESAATAQVAVSDIVSIKALYGFDTTPAATWLPDSGLNVTQWSRAMIDADNNGDIGNPADYQRIAAIRLAVVARSREPDKGLASECATTPNAPVVFSTTEPIGIATIPISVNVDVAGAPENYWKCYRYRTFETIVPIRNAGWRPGE